jgi:hypothetical protein
VSWLVTANPNVALDIGTVIDPMAVIDVGDGPE